MGGAAGHIQHVWEDNSLTFNGLYDIINKSLNNNIKFIEKIDGQNVLLSYKDNKIIIARSPLHLKQYGNNALDLNKTNVYFLNKKSKQCVINAFNYVIKTFEKAINNSDFDFSTIFKEGRVWANIEVVFTETENVIPYCTNKLFIHQLYELDENGKTKNTLPFDITNNLVLQLNCGDIIKTPNVNIKTNGINNKNINNIKNSLNDLLIESSLTLNNTIEDFMCYKLQKLIDRYDICDYKKKLLIYRWGKNDKSIRINTLLKGEKQDLIFKIRQFEKTELKDFIEHIKEPIKNNIILFGNDILNNISLLSVDDKIEARKILNNKILAAINNVKNSSGKERNILESCKNLIYKCGGALNIPLTEGIVFNYNNKTYKFVGLFTHILKLINYHKWGKI